MSKSAEITRLDGPNGGEFLLVPQNNPALCAGCGTWKKKLWCYVDPKKPTVLRPVACEECL